MDEMPYHDKDARTTSSSTGTAGIPSRILYWERVTLVPSGEPTDSLTLS